MRMHNTVGFTECCWACASRFETAQALQSHVIAQHAGLNENRNGYLEINAHGSLTRVRPRRNHAASTQFRCVHCSRTFGNREYLRTHIRRSYSVGEYKHCCWLCKESFKSEEELLGYLNSVHEEGTNEGQVLFLIGGEVKYLDV